MLNIIKQQTALANRLRFDYESLPDEVRGEAAENAVAIYSAIDDAGRSLWDAGDYLRRQKELLGHGNFTRWLREELGWQERRAQLLMQLPERWPDRDEYDTISILGHSVQQLLAAPSTPTEAIAEVVAIHAEGHKVKVKDAKAIIARYKTPTLDSQAVSPQPTDGDDLGWEYSDEVRDSLTGAKKTAFAAHRLPETGDVDSAGRSVYVGPYGESDVVLKQELAFALQRMLEIAGRDELESSWRQVMHTATPTCTANEWTILLTTMRDMLRVVTP